MQHPNGQHPNGERPSGSTARDPNPITENELRTQNGDFAAVLYELCRARGFGAGLESGLGSYVVTCTCGESTFTQMKLEAQRIASESLALQTR